MKTKFSLFIITVLFSSVVGFSQSSAYEVGTWEGFRTSAVTFSFDDNCANQFSAAVPALDRAGYKASFYPVINWGPNWTTLKNMANNGHEIGSHSVTHPSGAMTESELSSSKNTINQNIPGFDCNTVTYPNCIAPAQATCAKYYIGGRVCNGQVEGSTPSNYYQIGSIICGSAGSCNSLSAFQTQFNSAKNKKGWAVFLIHEIDNGSGYSPLATSILESALNYLKQNDGDFWVTTFRNAILYSKERNAAVVTELSNSAKEITMKVTDNLDNTIYNYPLSLRRALPSGWTSVYATQDGKEIEASIKSGYIYFSAVPDGGTVSLATESNVTVTKVTFTNPVTAADWNVDETKTISWDVENSSGDSYGLYWNTGGGTIDVTGAIASSEWSTDDGSFSWKASNILTDSNNNRWAAAGKSGYSGEWVALQLSSISTINGVAIKETSGQSGVVTGFEIQYSTDGTDYTTIKTGTTIGTDYTTSFSPVSAKYIRLYITSATNVNIDYFTVTGGAIKTELKSGITSTGSYDWKIGDSYGGTTGYLTIEASGNKVMATSASVSIANNNPPEKPVVTIEGGYTGPSCDGTGTGAYFTGIYQNLFAEILSKTETEVQNKINNIWSHFFTPGSATSVYYEVGNDMAYIYDTGNQDVRSEGMSYGMMICVQLDKKAEFDKLWKWAEKYMLYKSGDWDGYFAWQLGTDGTIKGQSCAPDGEAYFITSLFFAAHRWNDDSYAQAAQNILKKVMSKNGSGGVYNMFDATTKLITFVPYYDSSTFSDPSYNLPAFFELWARWSNTNSEFWKETPDVSRQLLRNSSHTTTGLFPDYCSFTGEPLNGQYVDYDSRRYMYDAIRCAMNIGMDYNWFGSDAANQTAMMTKLLTFFKNDGYAHGQFDWNGSNPGGSYSEGMAGANGVGCFALDDKTLAREYLNKLWSTTAPSGQWRYYNGMVYMLSMLHASGNFKIYKPAPEQQDSLLTGRDEVIFDGKAYTEDTTFTAFYDCKIYNVTIEIDGEPTSSNLVSNDQDDFRISPNPVKDRFTIYSKDKIEKVEIFNVEGSLMLTNKGANQVNVSNLSKGIYIVRIYGESGSVKTSKLIINN